MPQVKDHAIGWPNWVVLISPEPRVSRDFYTSFFGWDAYTLTATYWGEMDIFALGDVQGPEVAGMHMPLDYLPPSSWLCFFRVTDVGLTVEVVKAVGGLELSPPADFADLGRSAICCDPQGAVFGALCPYHFAGAGVVDEPSAMCWVELASRDLGQARSFYQEVFDWRAVDRSRGYTNFKISESSLGGMVSIDARWASHARAQWMPYFAVADCDASAARAVELGAAICIGPADLPLGKVAILNDPTGTPLGIVASQSGDHTARRRLP
ncbi:VOC family protein [Actinomadura coerulea]|uniref:VOC family protein n=1 Tax=Actinomadura coerulea TaxID=46159 RepID=UPI00343808D4